MKHPYDMTDDELRVAVATEVMGIEVLPDMRMPLKGPTQTVVLVRIPDYPRDWSAAIAAMTEAVKGTEWGWVIMGGDGDDEIGVGVGPVERVVGAAPRAICEAAVLAVRAKGGA